MDKETEIQITSRVAALEYLVAQLFRLQYETMGVTDEWIADSHSKVRRDFSRPANIVEGVSDPALSDHYAGEIATSIDSVLEQIEQLVARYRRRS